MQRGWQLQRLGDFDHDGWEDLLDLGADVRSSGYGAIVARIESGRDGAILSTSPFLPGTWQYVTAEPLGDMNQDGVLDYAVCIYDGLNPWTTQQIVVRSAADHSQIWSATIPNAWQSFYGTVIAGELDTDGDSRNDLVTSAPRLSPNGTIIVHANSGVERYRIVDPVPNAIVGSDVAPLKGDFDGDGCDDFLSAGADTLDRGAIVLFSGRTGAILRVSYGEQPGDKLLHPAGCGDLDGDGVLDYAGGGSFGNSVVTAFSGATGQIIHSWRDTDPSMGLNLISNYDLDQDGVNDLAAGSYNRWMNAFSGRDGTFLYRWPAWWGVAGSGSSLAMLAPPPGERYPVLVFAESEWWGPTNQPGANGINPGVLYAYRGCPRGVRAYGQPDASPGQDLPRSGMRNPTTQLVRFTLSDAAPSALAVWMLGTSDLTIRGSPLPIPLDPLGFPGITLLTSTEVMVASLTGASGMAAGYANYDVALPPGRVLDTTGTSLFAQWLWLDPNDLRHHGSTAGQRFRVR